jgi:hypothetical protein
VATKKPTTPPAGKPSKLQARRLDRASLEASRRKKVTRRMVLAAMGASAAAAALAAGYKANQWWNVPPGAGHKALSPLEYDVAQAMAEAWMPAADGPPSLSGAQADCGAFLDEVVSRMPDDKRKLIKLLLNVLDETPWPVEFRRFTQLDLPTRAKHLSLWLESPVFYHRQGVAAVMALISMGYTTHPEVAPFFARFYQCGYGR